MSTTTTVAAVPAGMTAEQAAALRAMIRELTAAGRHAEAAAVELLLVW